MYKCYPDSKRAHLKSGGNFPYLARSSEVNLMLQVKQGIKSMFVSMYDWSTHLDPLDDISRDAVLPYHG